VLPLAAPGVDAGGIKAPALLFEKAALGEPGLVALAALAGAPVAEHAVVERVDGAVPVGVFGGALDAQALIGALGDLGLGVAADEVEVADLPAEELAHEGQHGEDHVGR